MVTQNAGSDELTAGNFDLQSDMKVFIDMGHDTMKAARIFNGDFESMMNHFELPTVLAPEIVRTQQKLLKQFTYSQNLDINSSLKFFKQNIDQIIDRVIQGNLQEARRVGASFQLNSAENPVFRRPMVNGLIDKEHLDQGEDGSFEFIWEHMGRMFMQSHEKNNINAQDAGWSAVSSRVMMTDPALTMAANDDRLIEKARRQRERIAEIWFEKFGVQEFSLIPAQLPMIFSELEMDGFVVDLGHEMTQIVPIFGGMVDIRKVKTFPVGGIVMDSFLMQSRMDGNDRPYPLPVDDRRYKFLHYHTRTMIKEEMTWNRADLSKETSSYKLPDETFIKIDWSKEQNNPIRAYTHGEFYKSVQCLDVIRPIRGKDYNFPTQIDDAMLQYRTLDDDLHKFPITNRLFETIKDYCEDEEIRDFAQLQNIVITGGGANMPSLVSGKNTRIETLGQRLVKNIKDSILAESVTGLKTILSMDPRLSILQGARILMNLSTNQKQFVSSEEYFESGKESINRILI